MPDPDQGSDWKTHAATSAGVVVAFAGLFGLAYFVTHQPDPVGLRWNNAPGATIAIIERSLKLPPEWQQIAIVTNAEFYPVDWTHTNAFYRVAHPNGPGHRWNDVDRYIQAP
jgi:hypothetical protein